MKLLSQPAGTAVKTFRTLRKAGRRLDSAHRTPGLLVTAAIVGSAAALPFFLLAPGKAAQRSKAPFRNRNFAHRGLHTADRRVPENSLAAFRAAVGAGYGIELDVQLSADGYVVVFHDDTLKRVCGLDSRVDALRWSELRELRLCGTQERIPLFTEVLAEVGGKVPLIVELKTGPRNRELCEKTLALLHAYRGSVCIESFNPFIVSWFRFHAPEYLRGQLAMPASGYRVNGCPAWQSLLLSRTLFNAVARPQFIAYHIGPRPLLVRLSERMGAMRVGWTARTPSAERGRDAVIFEFYRPAIRYT